MLNTKCRIHGRDHPDFLCPRVETLLARVDCGKDIDCADVIETQAQCQKHYEVYMEKEIAEALAGKAEYAEALDRLQQRFNEVWADRGAATLQSLYDSEFNFTIFTFWDAGFDWQLGDELNGYKDGGRCDTLALAIQGLKAAAIRHSPNSVFAQKEREAIQ